MGGGGGGRGSRGQRDCLVGSHNLDRLSIIEVLELQLLSDWRTFTQV